jgi:hypothetical protein
MNKNIIINALLIILLYILLKNNILISINVVSISYLFISKVLPYFIIIFVISKLLINYNFVYYISKLFKGNIYVYILIISFISGSPNNIYLIKDLLNKKIINEDDANKLIKCTSFNNPLFLYSMLSSIFNKSIAIYIIIIQLISNIIIYLFNRVKINKVIKIETDNFNYVLINSIKDASNILVNIYLIIVVFNIIICIIPDKFNSLLGLLEITKGLDYLRYVNNSNFIKIMLANIYIAFGGLSIHMQIKSALIGTNISYYNYFKSRIYQIIISCILLLLYYLNSLD